jgi:undecaprenyl-diphosphatase
MLHELINIDHKLLLFFNSLRNPSIDPLMLFFTGDYFWAIALILILVLTFKQNGSRKKWLVLFCFILCFFLTERISVLGFKYTFERLRPLHNLQLQPFIHTLDCALIRACGNFGFVSSHAANSMGQALLAALVFRNKYVTAFLMFWCLSTSFTRIYWAAHYPADILMGWAVGIASACAVYFVYLKGIKRFGC